MRKMAFMAIACLAFIPPIIAQEGVPQTWWENAVWYEIFVRSFYDSDGDGSGDLPGVIQKLDYLNDGDPATTTDLGVTGIWLMPVTEAASYHGYDVTDYFAIESDYGTAEDFRQLIAEAHKRGIRVIVDMVLNHTSSQHEWFVKSASGDEAYADWYVWADHDPGYRGPWGQNVWYRRGNRFYYAVFWSEMPDLNFKHPAVTAEAYTIVDFWLNEMGVDGFRLDAIKYFVEDEVNGRVLLEDAPANRRWLADLNAHIKTVNPEAVTVGEIFDTTLVVNRYMKDNSVDTAFQFDLAAETLAAARTGSYRNWARQVINSTSSFGSRFAPFTTNHDQTRLMTMLQGNVEQNKVAATLLLTVPGSPFLYYGEEIGMTGTKLPSTDEPVRTPMQWDNLLNGGFTSGRPWTALNPDAVEYHVAGQTDDPNSLLSHYRALIHLRNIHPALRSTNIQMVNVSARSVTAYLRWTDDDMLLVVVNLDDEPVTDYTLGLREGPLTGVTTAEVLFGTGAVAVPSTNEDGGFADYIPLPELAPYSTLIIQLS